MKNISMNHSMSSIKRAKSLGANAVEYALVMAIIVALMITASQMMRPGIDGFFSEAGERVIDLLHGGSVANNAEGHDVQFPDQAEQSSGGGFWGGLWNGAVDTVSFGGNVIWGVGEGVWDLGSGVVTLGYDVVRMPFNGEVRSQYADAGRAIWDDPSLIVDAFVDPIADDWNNGNRGQAIGRGIFEVASLIVTPTKIAKLGKLDDVARVADDAAAIVRKLPDDLAGTFRGGRYATRVLEEDMILYRVGTADRPLGQFFSKDRPISEIQARIDKAILPEWPGGATSPIDTVFEIKIPAGTTIHTGQVSSQGGFYVGGTQQIVIEKPWLIEGIEILDSYPIN